MSDINPLGQNSFSPGQVIANAARKTGADFQYLLQTAARESSFDTAAQASTSSAAGMFQFIEQTWLAMMSRHGDNHGLGELAAQIEQSPNGRFSVSDPTKKQEILDLRFDPEIASVMAGELTAENAAQLESAIGRKPSTGELYAAHFLGASGASRLINLAETNPEVPAAAVFPEAASANKAVFEASGRRISIGELLSKLTGERGAVSVPEHMADYAPAEQSHPVAAFSIPRSVGVLTPSVVELLASLELPDRAKKQS